MRLRPSWCFLVVFGAVGLLGCDGTGEADGDADGTPDSQDCAPAEPSVFPSQTEACDGADEDCDGLVDEGFDVDGDGYTSCSGDCEDADAAIHPGVTEVCDGADNDCDETIDDGFDADGDLVFACRGDCDDADDAVATGLLEVQDGKDNDCSGAADEPFVDGDGDGFTPSEGDCDDDLATVGPRAVEFQGNTVDEDCDGTVDEAPVPCDGGSLDANDPLDFARAIGLCNGEVISAEYVGFEGGGAVARAIATQFGTNTDSLNRPAEGATMGILSSGRADTTSHDSGFAFDGTLGNGCTVATHPSPSGDPGACGAADPATVCDLAEIRLTIRVPANAQSFSYDFQYWSSEYPTFRCTNYDDTFLVLLTSEALEAEQNISFDDASGVISANTRFLDICLDDPAGAPRDTTGDGIITAGEVVPTTNDCSIENGAALDGTGYLFDNDATNNFTPDAAGSQSLGAGATPRLTSFAPVLAGETITLRFIIFDEGDDQLDSTAVIDNFRWGLAPVSAPITQQ